ncbi:MAG: diguanylate cyclase [Candidatus Electrothrix aestuarii]|uniref:Diguanylate cyclase n=1 Tax=Candidatus Electrothrix aestuarii TaxID=3062594 RepID=A0AAU8LXZ3_9BACT|nr:diguanylate cyclase [Candidatus Electrothrix aestuarii]
MKKQFHNIYTPNRLLRFLLLVIPVMLLSAFISLLFYLDEKRHQDDLHKGEETYVIGHHEQRIRETFLNITSDINILSKLYSENSHKEHPENALKNFEQILRIFSEHKQVYDQARLINNEGMEKIRINLVAGQSVLVPQEKLQNKGGRYYFQDSIKLKQGEVFISPFDLNMEHCTIEIPHKPMLRFGAPVFDHTGKKQGVVILNYLGQEILNQLTEDTSDRLNGKLMLLNRDGYWLHGEQQEDNWAFMWPEKADRTFGARYPEAWETISKQNRGQFQINETLFTFTTIRPLTTGMISGIGGCISPSEQQSQEIKAGDYYWKLVTKLPLTQIEQEHLAPVRYSLLLFNILLFILLGPLGWLLISFYTGREATRQELNHFKNVLDKTHDCVFMFDPKTMYFTYVNQGAQKQVGYSPEEFLKLRPVDIKPEFTEEKFQKIATTLIKEESKALFFQTVHEHKNGTRIPVEIHLQYIEPEHSAACFVAIVRDISERRKAEEALKAAHQRLLTVLDSMDAMVYVIDADSYEILFLNRYAEEIFGDLTGTICWKGLQKERNKPCDFCPNDLLRNSSEYADKSYVWERRNPFNKRWYELHDRVIRWFDGRDVKIQIATDITERKIMEQQLHYNAYHDCLTGLANRLLFYERLKQELTSAEKNTTKLALVFIDLNKFKPVNDQYGHDIGDLLLQEVARRLLSSVQETDLVARMGGDEFVLLLPDVQGTDEVMQVIRKLNTALEDPCQLSLTLVLTISAAMGTAIYPDDGTSEDELLNAADRRMYSNKREG